MLLNPPPLQVPAKVLHTAPEVDGEPQPKKLCAPPPSSDSNPNPPGSKAPPAYPYRCFNCTEECYHYDPATCVLRPKEEFLDSDSDDESESGEYEGERDGFAWVCLRCAINGIEICKFDHGGKSKGLYLAKSCLECNSWGHWTSECPHQTNSNTAAADHADAGEQTNNTSAA